MKEKEYRLIGVGLHGNDVTPNWKMIKNEIDTIKEFHFEQLVNVVKLKRTQLIARDLKGAVKEILGSCVSLGITVDGKEPKDVQKAIDEGSYNNQLME